MFHQTEDEDYENSEFLLNVLQEEESGKCQKQYLSIICLMPKMFTVRYYLDFNTVFIYNLRIPKYSTQAE